MTTGKGQDREFHVVVWGATGFTGKLVAEYLAQQYGVGGDLRWAIAGRSQARLEQVRESLGEAAAALPIIVADSMDAASLEKMVGRTRVVCSTVGPFAKYGSELVAACATHGTDYCDITGEAHWIRAMIDAHEEAARESGARIVHCCGFDSIPSDLGVLVMQEAFRARHGVPAGEIKFRVRRVKGKFSGGTFASMLAAVEAASKDPAVRRALGHPYSLNPAGEQTGPPPTDPRGPGFDQDVNAWVAPFVMAAINTKIVRRSNALMNYRYGKAFRYGEGVMTGQGAAGMLRAAAMSGVLAGFMGLLLLPPTRSLLGKSVLPQPGEGPNREERENGMFDIRLVALHPDDRSVRLRGRVSADRDPGYGATCRMLGESAVCLAMDAEPRGKAGGFWTPASCMGQSLVQRLERSAGMRFEVED